VNIVVFFVLCDMGGVGALSVVHESGERWQPAHSAVLCLYQTALHHIPDIQNVSVTNKGDICMEYDT
jgi:hypothetical protein